MELISQKNEELNSTSLALNNTNKEILIFNVEGNEFGLGIQYIHQILKPLYITRIANVEEYVLGVLNLRGDIIPVIDLKCLLGIGFADLRISSRIIVTVQNDRKVGVLVDSIKQVIKTDQGKITQSHQSEMTLNLGDFVESVFQIEDKMILILLIEQILKFDLNKE